MDAIIKWVVAEIVAIAAFFISAINFYYLFLQQCKIIVFIGDKIGLVKAFSISPSRAHLNCNFINNTNRNGVVDKLMLEMRTPDDKLYSFEWNEFYKYKGNEGVEPEALPFPIAINAKSSVYKGIQFVMLPFSWKEGGTTHTIFNATWVKGKYTMRLRGWVNKTNINENPNIIKDFQMELDISKVSDLNSSAAGAGAEVVRIPVKQWEV